MNGVEVQQSWPRKRGKKLDPKTLEQMEYFRQVQWAYKFSAALVQTSFRQAVHGTPLMPRDLFLMAASGRMHRVIDDQGRSWWSVAAIKNVSDALDVIAQLQGQLLVRRADRWGPLPVGSDGDVLTFNITTGMPEWAPGGSGGTPHWGSILGSLSAQADLEAALTAAAQTGQWGHISGSITAQADLEAALGAVAITANWGHISGSMAAQADLAAEFAALAAAITAATGEAAWGGITGSMAAQADLAAEFAALSAAITAATGEAAWGGITGSIAAQADLVAALAAAAVTAWGGITGSLSAQADLVAALAAKWNLTGNNVAVGNQTVTGYVAASEVRTSLIKGGATQDIRGDDVLIKSADGLTTYAEFNAAGGVVNAGGTTVVNITNVDVTYNVDIKRGAHRLWSRFIADPTGFSIQQYEKIVTRPRVANFTWVNQNPAGAGGTTAVDVDNGIYMENVTSVGGVQLRYLKYPAALPATWTVTMRSISQNYFTNQSYANVLVLRNTTSGRCLVFGDFAQGNTLTIDQWSAINAFSSSLFRQNGLAYAYPWRRITFDGTNIAFQASVDGNQWGTIFTTTAAAYINVGGGVINEVGWGMSMNNALVKQTLQHFDLV